MLTALILAAYQTTTPAPTPYMDKTNKDAIAVQEQAVCGLQTGFYGEIGKEIYVDMLGNRPKLCKTKPPEELSK